MKKLIQIVCFFFLIGMHAFGQNVYDSKLFKKSLDKMDRKLVKNSEECKRVILEAEQDYQQGKGKYFAIGDITNRDVVLFDLMEKELGVVEIDFASCSPDMREWCYELYANYKFRELYGQDIFDRLYITTDSLIEIGKGIEEPQYIGGPEKLLNDINNEKSMSLQVENDKVNKDFPIEIYIRVKVDTLGIVKDSEIYLVRNTHNKKRYEEEALRILSSLEGWEPGLRFGKKVVDFGYVTIFFGDRTVKE